MDEMRRARRMGPEFGQEPLRTIERLADERRGCHLAEAILQQLASTGQQSATSTPGAPPVLAAA